MGQGVGSAHSLAPVALMALPFRRSQYIAAATRMDAQAGRPVQKTDHLPLGPNWDAFKDCLSDMSWQQADGYVLLLEGWQDFAGSAPAAIKVARSILQDAAALKSTESGFFAIMAGKKRRQSSKGGHSGK